MGAIQLGQINPAGAQTNLITDPDPNTGFITGDTLFNVDATQAPQGQLPPLGQEIDGIRAVGNRRGVVGLSANNIGVAGYVSEPGPIPPLPPGVTNTGVLGYSVGGPVEPGVITPAGVTGQSDVGFGVCGVTQSGFGGVLGYGDNVGVVGITAPNGTGVFAPVDGTGVGVSGVANGAAGVGVQALATAVNGMGLFASDFDQNGREVGQAAGWFDGRVVVDGDLLVFGAKGAAVRQKDGSHRLLYSVESPESWFEDFGEGRLVKGKAKVKLEPGFASVVKADSFHVFLTPYGDSNGLYISQRNKQGFEVREQGNGKASVRFSYRIVAKRKDIRGERLAKIAAPKARPIAIVGKAPAIPRNLPGPAMRQTSSGTKRRAHKPASHT